MSVKIDAKKTWTRKTSPTYQGDVTLRKALAQSLNVPTVRLMSKIGIEETIRYARTLGIKSP